MAKGKEKRQNHKNDTIKYKLRCELNKMASYGRSKKQDMTTTRNERNILKNQGYSHEEQLRVNACKDHIYSFSTMENYQKEIGYFRDWLISNGYKKISIEESAKYIQPYIDHCVEKGLSPYTINKRLSAICKATHRDIQDYSHPKRSVAKITRGVAPAVHDKFNERNYAEIIAANRLLGLRRKELEKLQVGDIDVKDKYFIVNTVGKGGKDNIQVITDEKEMEIVKGWIKDREPDKRVFSADLFKNDVNFHKQRELRAKDVYFSVLEEIKDNPLAREKYKTFIKRAFESEGKKLRENLDLPYIARGENRERLIREGKPIEYDRVAILYVSLTVLNHYRSDTTVNHYVGK